jgi:hypothetical protein
MSLRIQFKSAGAKLILCAASLLFATNIAWAQQPQTVPSATPAPVARRATTRPFPAPRYIPPHNYDQRNIKLDLRFDWAQEQAIGSATITFVPTIKDLRRVEFDAAFMTVSAAALANGIEKRGRVALAMLVAHKCASAPLPRSAIRTQPSALHCFPR